MATQKKSAAPKKTLAESGITSKMLGKSAPKTTLAGIQAFPAKTSKSATPAILAKAGKQFGADAAGVPGSKKPTKAPKGKSIVDQMELVKKAATKPMKPKRTVSLAGATRLSDVPDHEVHSVEDLRAKLAEFPRGAIFTVTAPFINVYNLRGRLIGRIKDGPKQKKAKTARADKV